MKRGLEVDRVLQEIGRNQFGLVVDAQAIEKGVSASQIRRRIQSGCLVRVFPRVCRLSGAVQSWEQKLLSVCLWAGRGWVASGIAAGFLWELDGIRGRRLEISGGGRISRSPAGVLIHERCRFVAGDVTSRNHIPVTAPARTIIDLSASLGEKDLERALESAIRRGLLTPEFLMRRMRRLGTRGRRQIRKLIEILVRRGDAPPTDSDFETLLLQAIRDGGLPVPDRQVPVHDADGFIARVDFIYQSVMLIIEADSYKHHGGREDWEGDEMKRARLSALGYRILPITWRMLKENPNHVRTLVRNALSAKSPWM